MKRSGYERCFFAAPFGGLCTFRYDGLPDPAHLIPQQRLRKAGVPLVAFTDPRIIVPACRHHHDLFDRKLRPLPLDAYPDSAKDFADEYGFEFFGPRDGWRKVETASSGRRQAPEQEEAANG